jgi:hypothetical protein
MSAPSVLSDETWGGGVVVTDVFMLTKSNL